MEFRLPGVPPADLVDLYQRRALNEREYKMAIEWATKPPARERWAGYLRDWCLVFGLILLVAGVVVFGAYNWQALPHLQKLGLLQMLLIGAWGGSRLREPGSLSFQALLWTACMLVGALLAVFGQIYQTGADAYTLFLVWSALIVPWCLAGRSTMIWTTQAALLHVAFTLYWDQRVGAGLAFFALAYGGLSGALALLWERLRSRERGWMKAGLTDALFANALTPLTVAACGAFWEGDEYWLCLVASLVLAAVVMWGKRRSWPLRRLAVLVFSLTAVAAAATIRMFIEWDVFGMLLIGLALLGEVTVAAAWLRRLDREGAPRPTSRGRSEAPEPDLLEVLASNGLLEETPGAEERRGLRPTPAYVSVLAAVGAWLSSWFFLGFVGLGLSGSESGLIVTGLLLWAGTILGRRSLKDRSEFLSYLCLAVNLAGQLMVMIGMSVSSGMGLEPVLGTAFFLQSVGLLWFKDRVGCGLFACASVISGGLFFWSWAGGFGLNLWLLAVAMLISRLLIGQRGWLLSRWREWHGAVALGWCFGFFLMVGVWNSGFTWLWGVGWNWDAPEPALLALGLTLLAAANAVRLQAPLTAVAGVLLLGSLTFTMPGLMAALLVFMLAFHTRSQGASRLSILALLVFGVLYYYNLDLPFLAKSATLIASGLLLLVVRSAMRGLVARHAF